MVEVDAGIFYNKDAKSKDRKVKRKDRVTWEILCPFDAVRGTKRNENGEFTAVSSQLTKH